MGVGEADLKFHETLIKAAHIKKLESIYKTANLPLSVFVPKEINKQELIQDACDHAAIVEELKNKNLSAMVKLLSRGIS